MLNMIILLDYMQQHDPRINGFNAYSANGRQTPKQQDESSASRRQRNLVDLIQQVKKKSFN